MLAIHQNNALLTGGSERHVHLVPTVEIMKAHYAQHTITLFVTNQPAMCAEEVGKQMSCVNQKIPKTLVRVGFGLFRKR